MGIEKELTHTTFLQREYDIKHDSYQDEISIFNIVARGDIKHTDQVVDVLLSKNSCTLSTNKLRHTRYVFVAYITLVTRFAMEGGMLEKDAYNLSDLYIQKMDTLSSVKEIKELFKIAVEDYTHRVYLIRTKKVYSKPILQAIDYIYDNLHYNLTVEDIAEAVNLSPSYFSSLFKKETGTSVAGFVRNMRIDAAKNMLQFSNYSYQEISNYLAFSSQSHFISIFKKKVGVTPKEYRMSHFATTGWADLR